MRRAFALLLATALGASAAWERWENCQLAVDAYFDGDSFHIHRGRQDVIVRLYYVDAPETDASYPARLREQAAYFGVSETTLLRGGLKAKAFAADWLTEPFTVITRRQIAPGASRSERYYAIIERRGNRLDTALVAAGFARPNAVPAEYPSADAGAQFARQLRELELKAAQGKRGLWSGSNRADPRTTSSDPDTARTLPSPRKTNVNTASKADLESLPGIGPVLATEMIKARPIRSLQQLDQVPGIGPKTIEKLRELVAF